MLLNEIFIFFLISLLSLYLILFLSKKFNFFDLPKKYKIHKVKIPNCAGLSFLLIIPCYIYFFDFDQKFSYFLTLLFFLTVYGFLDDRFNFEPISKLIFLFFFSYFFSRDIIYVNDIGIFFSKRIFLGTIGLIFTIGCLLLIINAANYLDGQDGMLATLSIISLVYISLLVPFKDLNFIITIIIFLLVFLFFNWGLLPKQFLGDSGSLSLGFIIAFCSIYYTQHKHYILPNFIIWPLGIFVYEFITINIIRFYLKKNLFKRDLNFTFNVLSRIFGQKFSFLIFTFIHLSLCMVGLFLYNFKMYNLSYILFILFFVFYLNFRFYLFRHD